MQDFEALTGDKVPVARYCLRFPAFKQQSLIKTTLSAWCNGTPVPTVFCTSLVLSKLNAPSGGKGYRTGLRGGGP